MTNITVSLHDELASQAQSAGLLGDEAIAALLREASGTKSHSYSTTWTSWPHSNLY